MNATKCSVNVFKLICIISACCMIGYWIHKFIKNEDVSLIEYKLFEETESILLPELSVCFWNPILSSVLKNLSIDVTNDTYLQYINGNKVAYQNHREINYDEVTLQLSDFVSYITIGFRPERNKSKAYCGTSNNCPYISLNNNYNGLTEGDLIKCFGFRVNYTFSKDIAYIIIWFKESFGSILKQFSDVSMMIHYPGQMLRRKGIDQAIWTDPTKNKIVTSINIDLFEILFRRDKPKTPCIQNSIHYDDLIVHRHMKNLQCKAPYHSMYDEYPVCETLEKLRDYRYNGFILPKGNFSDPCQEMTFLSFKYTTTTKDFGWEGFFPLFIYYPDRIKYVKQSQDIDIHALIGNIGGYIGLFLGNSS